MSDVEQQIIYYALMKSLERCDYMLDVIISEITERLEEFNRDTLFSIRHGIKYRLEDEYFWNPEDKELAEKLLAAVEQMEHRRTAGCT